jgi:hypothetical protein
MEYIRLSYVQPDHNPSVRHYLYGLDADVIMLGLLSHNPHFYLLREEVKFGPSSRKKGHGRYVVPPFVFFSSNGYSYLPAWRLSTFTSVGIAIWLLGEHMISRG